MFLINIVPVIALLIGQAASQSYESCLTPNQLQGVCKPFKDCQSMITLLSGFVTPQIRDFARKSQCGTLYNQPWVCCATQQFNERTTRPPIPAWPTAQSSLPKAPYCGIDESDKIYGGEVTKIDEYPWLARLEYSKPNNQKGFHCGGVLINERYVLTAAHCILKVPATYKPISVRLGEWDTTTSRDCDDSLINEIVCSDPAIDITIEEKIVHESYDANSKNQHNDIALLRLSRPVKYSHFIKPICLPIDSALKSIDLGGMTMDVAGWGKTETASSSKRKLKVAIDGYSNADCQRIYSTSNIQIIDSQICAGGDPGRDSCNGDSGGPLMRLDNGAIPHYFLAGIVSYGPKNCGTPDIPGVYTRTSKFIDWIQSKIRA